MGYIVQAMAYPILDVPALAFIVQSPDNSHEDIDTAVQSFLKSQKERLATMSSDRFQRQKEAVISRIAEDPTQLSEVADRYWQEIDRMNLDFDTRENSSARSRSWIRSVSRKSTGNRSSTARSSS